MSTIAGMFLRTDGLVERGEPIHAMDTKLLMTFARKYIWWKTPEEAVAQPERIVAQVMDLGDYDDVQSLVHEAGTAYLREVLRRAEAGQFNARSWTYWHYRLGLSDPGKVPALPERRVA
jgi:hypothetical protein